MEEISDTNDNKNRKINLIQQFIDGGHGEVVIGNDGVGGCVNGVTRSMDTDSSWIQFQGNNNNVNDKPILRSVCDGVNVGGRPTDNLSTSKTTTTTTTTTTITADVNLTLDAYGTMTTNATPMDANEDAFAMVTPATLGSSQPTAMCTDSVDQQQQQQQQQQQHNGIKANGTSSSVNNTDVTATVDVDTDADDATDNSSDITDNLSLISDDGDKGLIEDIIIISDDELSTNSDDCVYAYRGADFDPVHVSNANPEDENDFLEMDFEPDPSSEVEQDNNALLSNGQLGNGLNRSSPYEHAVGAVGDNLMDFNLPPINTAQNAALPHFSDSIPQKERSENNDASSSTNITFNQRSNSIENRPPNHEKLCRRKHDDSGASTSGDFGETSSSSYYDNTVTLSTTKYTGTIPKTSRISNNIRAFRQKTTNLPSNQTNTIDDCAAELKCRQCAETELHGESSSAWSNRQAKPCERCETLKSCGQRKGKLHHGFNSAADVASHSERNDDICDGIAAKRSMSFPVVNRHENGYADHSEAIGPTNDFNALSAPNRYQPLGFAPHEIHETDSRLSSENSVSIYSICYTENIIVDALRKINIRPNMEILRTQLELQSMYDPTIEATMNIAEYLTYMSKKNCDYKALMTIIRLACPDDDFELTFIPFDIQPETVQISINEVINRFPTNGSLNNILSIRNKKFHKMNVLGKVVNILRKFSDMRQDINRENYITIPQYYRSGYVYVCHRNSTSTSNG